MSKYIGRLLNLGLARETVRGTAEAAAFWTPKTSIAFFDRASKADYKQSYGVIGHGAQAPKIMEWAEGTIQGDILDVPFGLIMLAAFGTLSSSGVSDSAYTHTFTLQNDNQHDSLTLTLADPDRTDQFSLAMLESLEINIVPDEIVSYSATFKSRTGRQVAAASPTYSTYNKFLGRHAVVKIASVVGGLAAASALKIKSLNITISKNTVMNNILGTVWPDDIINTKFDITGDIELDLEDQTYRDLALSTAYRALRIQLTNTDVLIGATSRPDLKIDLARVFFEGWEKTAENDELVTQKISFRALYDTTTSTIINSVTLINNQATY